MKDIQGDIVNRFMMRGKFVVIVKMLKDEKDFYVFRVTDKCNKKDYYSNERYETQEQCESDSRKICKAI